MNLQIFLLVATIITGLSWVASKFFVASKNTSSSSLHWLRKIGGYFFVLLAVFVFRSFLFELFLVPSPSMVPTLLVSDYIVAKKFSYSLKLPITDQELIRFEDPKKGDIVVFKNPLTPNVDYVKRIVGVPGDKVTYFDKRLAINGQPLEVTPNGTYKNAERDYFSNAFTENLAGIKHTTLNDPDASPATINPSNFDHKDKCSYRPNGIECTVPEGSYFMMGDNRDNSLDSRSWGFVPRNYIAGKVSYILINPKDLSRSRKVE